MTEAPKPKARRLGGKGLPPTPSTTENTTPPTAPGTEAAVGQAQRGLVPVPDQTPAAPAEPPADQGDAGAVWGPVQAHGRVRPSSPEKIPDAREVCRPRERDGRVQLNVAVPEVLQLQRRMRRYWVEHEVEVRDQAAIAIDGWLRAQGY